LQDRIHLQVSTGCQPQHRWELSLKASNSSPRTISGWVSFEQSSYKFNYCYKSIGPPLWSSGQSSWLQIRRSGFDFQHYQIFWEVVSLERSPLSLVSTTEQLLQRNCSSSSIESREYGSVAIRCADSATPSIPKSWH
jgi:hypothetical protein